MADIDIAGKLEEIVEPWIGYNFVVFSLRDPFLTAAGIDDVQFPVASVTYFNQKGVGNRVQKIPGHIDYSDLVIRAKVERLNTVFSSKLDRLIDYIGGKANLSNTTIAKTASSTSGGAVLDFLGLKESIDLLYDNLSIVAMNTGGITGQAPIGVWYMNVLPASYAVDPVNSMNDQLVHETLTYKCNSMRRVI